MNHLFPYIERTLLHPNVTIAEQYTALDEVHQLGLAGLVVAPFWYLIFSKYVIGRSTFMKVIYAPPS